MTFHSGNTITPITLTNQLNKMKAKFVIIGGGIAGVTCAETLAFYQPEEKIILVSESSLIKTVTNLLAITQTLTTFDIKETSIESLEEKHSNIKVIHAVLLQIDDEENIVTISPDIHIKFNYLCLCTGARPKLIPQAKNNPFVLGIRDTDSVETFLQKLQGSKNIMIVGNGGIASELVHKIENASIDWVIKDNHITATFVDLGAAEFFQPSLKKSTSPCDPAPSKRMRYEEENQYKSGAALGPDWYKSLNITGANVELGSEIKIHYKTEIQEIITHPEPSEFPVEVILSNGERISCNFIVSATGVEPKLEYKMKNCFHLSPNHEIEVNEFMQTSLPNIYAAGDVCFPKWNHAKHWFPMKLWTQARQMGCYAAKCMSAALTKEEILQDFCFEIFTHTTKLFGYKVILLGLYNGQKLGTDYEILFRMTKRHEYIKLVLQDHKLQGAVLIGETDLEETCENLILNQLDLSAYKEDLLNPDIDIEDYFD